MARNDVISKLYKKSGSALDFNFDSLMAPPLQSLIPYQDLERMYKLVTSVKYNSKILYKEQEIRKIMEYHGWKRYASGTHRVVYRHLEIPTIIAKISLNKSSLGDNVRELYNQQFLKPFVTKVFSVDPSGMIGIFERVEPFQSRDEFISVAGDIFDMINTKIIGKYVVDDIGTESYMNYGIRKAGPYSDISFGPVLLDFPEVYPLDGDKLYCNKNDRGFLCGGVLDYDNGYNIIRCTKCGRVYEARELMKAIESHEVIKKGRNDNMKLEIMRGDTVVKTVDSSKEATDIIRKPRRTDLKPKSQMSMISQALGRGQKYPPTHKLDVVEQTVAESHVKFCGGYVTEEPKVETPVEDTTEQEAIKKMMEYNTDTGFIPKEEFMNHGIEMETEKKQYAPVISEEETIDPELSFEAKPIDNPEIDKLAEEIAEKMLQECIGEKDHPVDSEEPAETSEEELGGEPEVETEELGGEPESEDVAEDELGGETYDDELGEDFTIDPQEVANSMMNGNPFAQ